MRVDMEYVVVPKDPLGDFIRVYLAWAKDEEIRRRRAGSGGAVTAFLAYLLEEGVVDAVLVARKAEGLRGVIQLARCREEILTAAGDKWNVVPYTRELGEALRSADVEKVAIVGLPCQAQFLAQMRLMPLMESDFSEKIKVVISLFCFGTFATDAFIAFLEREHGLKSENVASVLLRGENIIVVSVDGRRIIIPIKEALKYIQHGCLVCPDYTGIFADLSAGISESHLGKTVLIVRNEETLKMLEDAAGKGYLGLEPAPPEVFDELEMKAEAKKNRAIRYLSMIA